MNGTLEPPCETCDRKTCWCAKAGLLDDIWEAEADWSSDGGDDTHAILLDDRDLGVS